MTGTEPGAGEYSGVSKMAKLPDYMLERDKGDNLTNKYMGWSQRG